MVKLILTCAFSFSLIIRIFLILNGKHVADIWHVAQMGNTLLLGQNPYLVLDFNVYPPLSIAISAISIILSNITAVPFHMIIKIWPNLADLATAAVIYKYLSKQRVKPLHASIWTGIFLMNPISIITSAAHGQLDSIVSFLIILSIYFFQSNRTWLTALSLGLSIAVKPNPLMLMPLFLFLKPTAIFTKLKFLLIVLTPITISLLVFLIQNPLQILKNLFGYSGVADFGYAAILRGIWFQDNASANLPPEIINLFFSDSKLVLLAGITFLILLFAGWKEIIKPILATYLLFIAFYFGISAQYLSWVIPLAILARERLILLYSVSGVIALAGFYLYFGPDVLLGKMAKGMLPFENKYIYYYFYGNLTLWAVNLFWLGKIITNFLKSKACKLINFKKQLLFLAILIFILALIPLLKTAQKFLYIYQSISY